MKAVLRSEPALKRASWPSRLLDSLGGLGGWLVGPDPGLNRLRTVLCATLTIAGAIGAEWLFVHVTGALQRPMPPAPAGAAAAARVAAPAPTCGVSGPAGVRVGPQLFNGYLFGFLLGSVITLGDTGWLAAEIGVGILVAIVVKVGVFHDTSTQALRRTQRSYQARTRRLAGLALVAFDEPGPWSSRRLHRQKTRLGEAAQVIDGQLADPGAAPAARSRPCSISGCSTPGWPWPTWSGSPRR